MTAYTRFANALAWHAYEVATGLAELGHQVLFFCQTGSPLSSKRLTSGIVVNSELDLGSLSPISIIRCVRIMKPAVQSFAPDILHPHCSPGHSFLAAIRGRTNSRIPIVRTVAEPKKPKRNPFSRLVYTRHADALILTNHRLEQTYRQAFDLRHVRVQTVLPGFRADQFAEHSLSGGFRDRYDVKKDQLLVGIVARMSPEKGQEVFIEAMTRLDHATRARIFCVCAGEDSKERGQFQLKRMVAAAGLEYHFGFPGRLQDVRPLLSELDIGVITSSSSEAVCRVALEYMSFGIPIISSDVNILPEVVLEGETGWIFDNKDSSALAKYLTEAVWHPETRKRLGSAGYKRVRSELSSEREMAELLSVFAEQRAKSGK